MVAGFGVIILVMIVVNGLILLELNALSSTVRSALSTDVRALDGAKQLRTLLYDEERHAQKFLVSRDTLYLRLFVDVAARFEHQLDSVRTLIKASRGNAYITEISRTHIHLFRDLEAREDIREAAGEIPLTRGAVRDSLELLHTRLDGLIYTIRNAMSASILGLEASTDRALEVAIMLTVLAVIGTAIVALAITHTITRPLRVLREGTRLVARGEFRRISVRSRDEIAVLADAFNDMSSELKRSQDLRAEMMQQIAHEIRIPLQSIHSAYYLLTQQIRGPVNERQRELLDTIRKNTERIADFSNQFLDLAKIEAGMMEFEMRSLDLAPLVEAALEGIQVSATEKEIRTEFRAGPIPVVDADPMRLSQVFTNLLSNALKFTGRGGMITVTLEAFTGGARTTVRDTGTGIHPDDLPHIFSKFYQATGERPPGTKGSGLGLALVKAIVEYHNGKVSVESEVGRGSVFVVDLPAAHKEQNVAEDNHP
jgi:signal transduction histidine kinase